jgi:putative transposase
VEDLLAERGIDVSYETVRRWALKFGRTYAGRIRYSRPRPSDRSHLDEVFIRIGGKIHYLWRAVVDDGEVLDIIVQPRRDRKAALKLLRRLLKRQGYLPACGAVNLTEPCGAICPAEGKGAGIVLPFCDTPAMQVHPDEIGSRRCRPRAAFRPSWVDLRV